jgi:hypothetical protein
LALIQVRDAGRLVSTFIAAIMKISASVKAWHVLGVMENMATCSDLRSRETSVPELARDSAVPDWDTLGRWLVRVFPNLADA